MKRITKINDNEYISKEVDYTTSLTGTIIELIIYLVLLAILTKFVNIWLQEVKIMRGHGHFKFEQYKLWCKNHHKKACEYVNFKVFIELYRGVK